ncbi:MAG: YwaF family protein [Firmicutes bacterium]|nr:YwaF family protein [Bacillota bacterium]
MVWEWIVKFFGYFKNGTSVSSFSDGLGEGSFGWRHFIWMFLVIALAIGGYLYFKKYPKREKAIVLTLVISMFLVRFFHQTLRASIGVETPWTMAFPFHMCTVLTFLLPLTIVFNWKAIKTPVYVLSIMGGIITVLLGGYFSDRFLTFWALEGMAAHTLLIVVPIYEAASGKFEFNLKESWKVIPGILVLMGWATLANYVFFPNMGANYMYLVTNELPFGNQQNFFFFYMLIFALFFGLIYGIPLLLQTLAANRLNGKPKETISA